MKNGDLRKHGADLTKQTVSLGMIFGAVGMMMKLGMCAVPWQTPSDAHAQSEAHEKLEAHPVAKEKLEALKEQGTKQSNQLQIIHDNLIRIGERQRVRGMRQYEE